MPDWLRDLFDWIGAIGDVGAIIAYTYGFWALWRARSAYLQRKRLLEKVGAEGTVAISIGIGVDIRADVEAFLGKQHPGVPLAYSFHQPGVVSAQAVPQLVQSIRAKMQPTVSSGQVRRALLFYGGPTSVAMALGAIFDNWVPVEVYQYNPSTKSYEHHFTLDLETVKGVRPL